MSDPHAKLEAFFDGQLSAEEAEAFRQHYATCDECDRRMGELMAMDAMLELRHQRAPVTAVAEHRPGFFERFSWLHPSRAGLAFAAMVALVIGSRTLLVISPDTLRGPDPGHRHIEGRSAHPGAQQYLPLGSVLGGAGDGNSLPSSSSFAKLSLWNDRLGRATAYLVRGQSPGAALKEMESLTGPDIDSERALAYLVRKNGDAGDSQEAIRYAERALAANPKHGPALWNKALALKQLGLGLMAARTFEEAAAVGEPGWDQEARKNADELRGSVKATQTFAAEAAKAGEALRLSGALPDDRYLRFPDLRWYFYDAVRMRTSVEDVNKLMPLAKKLDEAAHQTAAQDYLGWVAGRDFTKRAPLVKLFSDLVLRPGLPGEEKVIDRLWDSGESDLAVGAMSGRAPAIGPDLKQFEARCHGFHDPWYEVLALQRRATALEGSETPNEAIQPLELALAKARAASIDFREAQVATQLIVRYIKSSQLDEAYELARATWQTVSRNSDWDSQLEMIKQSGQVARLLDDAPLARAYLQEAEERIQGTDDPIGQRFIHEQRASLERVELRADAARTHLDAAIATKLPLTIIGASTLADVARIRPEPAVDRPAMERFKTRLETARISVADRALATHVLGRWTLEIDPAEGVRLIREAMKMAADAPQSPDAARALAYGYTALIMEAGKRGDFPEALRLLREEAGAPLPPACAVAITTDSERSVVLALDEHGGLGGAYDGARTVARPDNLKGYVTPPLLASLERCSEVKVLARAPLLGRPGALPSRMAWSFLLLGKGSGTEPQARPSNPRQLVIQNPQFSDRRLKQVAGLSGWIKPSEHPELSILSGERATPSAVLREMETANELTIVTHSLLNRDSGEAYLVLAEDGPGQDRLRAGQIKPGSLKGNPLVLLVACDAAIPAPVLWSPHSLPAAFLGAGARAVLAATEEIPSDDGPRFFNEVRARIQGGVPPAIALRDVRQSWLQKGEVMTWPESVLLFE